MPITSETLSKSYLPDTEPLATKPEDQTRLVTKFAQAMMPLFAPGGEFEGQDPSDPQIAAAIAQKLPIAQTERLWSDRPQVENPSLKDRFVQALVPLGAALVGGATGGNEMALAGASAGLNELGQDEDARMKYKRDIAARQDAIKSQIIMKKILKTSGLEDGGSNVNKARYMWQAMIDEKTGDPYLLRLDRQGGDPLLTTLDGKKVIPAAGVGPGLKFRPYGAPISSETEAPPQGLPVPNQSKDFEESNLAPKSGKFIGQVGEPQIVPKKLPSETIAKGGPGLSAGEPRITPQNLPNDLNGEQGLNIKNRLPEADAARVAATKEMGPSPLSAQPIAPGIEGQKIASATPWDQRRKDIEAERDGLLANLQKSMEANQANLSNAPKKMPDGRYESPDMRDKRVTEAIKRGDSIDKEIKSTKSGYRTKLEKLETEQAKAEAAAKKGAEKQSDGERLNPKQLETLASFRDSIRVAEDLRKRWKEKYTGWQGIAAKIPFSDYFRDSDAVTFEQDLGKMADLYRHAITGAGAGMAELNRLEGRLPRLKDPDKNFQASLDNVIRTLKDKQTSWEKTLREEGGKKIGGQGGGAGTGSGSSYDDKTDEELDAEMEARGLK